MNLYRKSRSKIAIKELCVDLFETGHARVDQICGKVAIFGFLSGAVFI